MNQQQIISAITTALQTPDSNGEFANVVLAMQTILINQLPLMDLDHLQLLCNALGINTNQGS